jgi:predicted ArsR family transcriptional regulator
VSRDKKKQRKEIRGHVQVKVPQIFEIHQREGKQSDRETSGFVQIIALDCSPNSKAENRGVLCGMNCDRCCFPFSYAIFVGKQTANLIRNCAIIAIARSFSSFC